MGDQFTAAATSVGVLLSAALVVALLLAAWVHRSRRVVRGPGDLDRDLTTTAPVVGTIARRHTGGGVVDSHQGRRLLAALSEAVGPGPVTILVLAPGSAGVAEDVAAALAVAADGQDEPVTLVHAPGGERLAAAPPLVLEHELPVGWLGDDADLRPTRVDELLEELETADDGSRTVVVAAPAGAEALAFAPFVDVALVVAERGVTQLNDVDHTVADLEAAGAETVVVTVLEAAGPAARTGHAARIGIAVAVVVTTGLLASVPWLLDRDPGGDRAAPTSGPREVGAVGRETGPGGDRPGVRLTATADPDGTLLVVEQVLAARSLSSVRVAPPPAPEGATTAPTLTGLRISADGEPVEVADDTIGDAGVVVPLPGGATRLELTYRVTGAGYHSEAAPAGRTSFSLRPATERSAADLRVVTDVRGEGVLGVVCPEVPPERRLCGVDRELGWRTRPVPATQSVVVALVDLPPGTPVEG